MIKTSTLLDISMSVLPELITCEKKHFSFIVRKNEIISMGVNRPFKTHPLAKEHNYRYAGIHSELDALLRVPYGTKLNRCSLINIRLSPDSIKRNRPVLRMSKPCPKCLPWIEKLCFRDILYSTDDGFVNL